MDTGPEAIHDDRELAAVRRQARTVQLKALGLAAVLTVAAVLIPT